MNIDRVIELLSAGKDDCKVEGFLKYLSEKLWNSYIEYLMDKLLIVENEIKGWKFTLPNAKESVPYEHTVEIKELVSIPGVSAKIKDVTGIDEDMFGLKTTISEDGRSFTIAGTPTLALFRVDGKIPDSIYELKIQYAIKGIDIPEGKSEPISTISLVINQDPQEISKQKMQPTNWDIPEPKYHKEDEQSEYVKVEALEDRKPQKDIVSASKRGRSHAWEAKPRDDHFKNAHLENGWYIMSVADGAGSAQYSREGSRIACETVVDYCTASLNDCAEFEEHIKAYNSCRDDGESEARKIVGDDIYKIVGAAAYKAQKAIFAEADSKQIPRKKYGTTLLLTISKCFSFGWFVASFWVGDGAICLYNRNSHKVRLLGTPDEGEFGGQTRFLTMTEIFTDSKALYQRLRFNIVEDFTALFLMSDGVSDPKFETDNNLNNPDKWDELWDDLTKNEKYPVDLSDDHEAAKDELLAWLDFWSPGNHDDRTISILY